MRKKGKVYSLEQWLLVGGSMADIDNKPSFSTTGSVAGMRKLYYGYNCDLVRYRGFYYKVN